MRLRLYNESSESRSAAGYEAFVNAVKIGASDTGTSPHAKSPHVLRTGDSNLVALRAQPTEQLLGGAVRPCQRGTLPANRTCNAIRRQ